MRKSSLPKFLFKAPSPLKEVLDDYKTSPKDTFKSILGWLTSCLLGSLIAFTSSGIVLPLTFGVERKDSASLWMLAGLADFYMGFLVLPVFLIAHTILYKWNKSAEPTLVGRACNSSLKALLIYWVALVLFWYFGTGNQPVIKSS